MPNHNSIQYSKIKLLTHPCCCCWYILLWCISLAFYNFLTYWISLLYSFLKKNSVTIFTKLIAFLQNKVLQKKLKFIEDTSDSHFKKMPCQLFFFKLKPKIRKLFKAFLGIFYYSKMVVQTKSLIEF